jgi:hypothetical protein
LRFVTSGHMCLFCFAVHIARNGAWLQEAFVDLFCLYAYGLGRDLRLVLRLLQTRRGPS